MAVIKRGGVSKQDVAFREEQVWMFSYSCVNGHEWEGMQARTHVLLGAMEQSIMPWGMS